MQLIAYFLVPVALANLLLISWGAHHLAQADDSANSGLVRAEQESTQEPQQHQQSHHFYLVGPSSASEFANSDPSSSNVSANQRAAAILAAELDGLDYMAAGGGIDSSHNQHQPKSTTASSSEPSSSTNNSNDGNNGQTATGTPVLGGSNGNGDGIGGGGGGGSSSSSSSSKGSTGSSEISSILQQLQQIQQIQQQQQQQHHPQHQHNIKQQQPSSSSSPPATLVEYSASPLSPVLLGATGVGLNGPSEPISESLADTLAYSLTDPSLSTILMEPAGAQESVPVVLVEDMMPIGTHYQLRPEDIVASGGVGGDNTFTMRGHQFLRQQLANVGPIGQHQLRLLTMKRMLRANYHNNGASVTTNQPTPPPTPTTDQPNNGGEQFPLLLYQPITSSASSLTPQQPLQPQLTQYLINPSNSNNFHQTQNQLQQQQQQIQIQQPNGYIKRPDKLIGGQQRKKNLFGLTWGRPKSHYTDSLLRDWAATQPARLRSLVGPLGRTSNSIQTRSYTQSPDSPWKRVENTRWNKLRGMWGKRSGSNGQTLVPGEQIDGPNRP